MIVQYVIFIPKYRLLEEYSNVISRRIMASRAAYYKGSLDDFANWLFSFRGVYLTSPWRRGVMR
jgi:hypothetical protein